MHVYLYQSKLLLKMQTAAGPKAISRATIFADVLQDCVSTTAAQHKKPPRAQLLLTRRKINSK